MRCLRIELQQASKGRLRFRIIRGAENIEGTQRARLRSEKQALDWITKICANFDGELQTLKEESLQPIMCRTSAAKAAAKRYSHSKYRMLQTKNRLLDSKHAVYFRVFFR